MSTQISSSYCLFDRGGQRFALPTAIVQEAVTVGEIVPIPRSPDVLVGVTNLRGTLLPVFDFDSALGVQSEVLPQRSTLLVIRESTGQAFGFLTDRVSGVREMASTGLQTIPGENGSILSGIWPDVDGLLVYQVESGGIQTLLRQFTRDLENSVS